MNMGLIGYGSIGQRHAANIRELFPRSTLNVLTKRKDVKSSDKNVRFFSSEKKFYAAGPDIFFITNETHKHAATILRCLRHNPAGIFVEKPISHSLKDIAKIRKEIKKRKPVFFVAYCLQFFKPLVFLKKMIKQKKISVILSMRVSAGKDLRTWRKGDYRKSYSGDSKKGGGVTLDLIHEINYPAWLLGEKLRFVKGFSGNISDLKIKSEDMAEGLFVSEKGKIISVHQDYFQVPGKRYCEILGSRGTLIWEKILRRGSEDNEIKLHTDKRTKIFKIKAGGNDMYRKELAFFIKKTREKKGYSNLEESASDLKNALALKGAYFHGF